MALRLMARPKRSSREPITMSTPRVTIEGHDELVDRVERRREVRVEVTAIGRAGRERVAHARAHRLRLAGVGLLVDDMGAIRPATGDLSQHL